MNAETVRKQLLLVWAEQACRNPAYWPEVQERLLEKRGDGYDDGARLDAACTELAGAFSAPQLPSDPAQAIRRAWPKLTRENCCALATLLVEARDREQAPPIPRRRAAAA
jgi:hypothetical protein